MDGAENNPPIHPARTINKGRPLGSTKINIAKSNSDKLDCITAIEKYYQCLVEQTGEKYSPTGYLTKLIAEKKEEFGLPADYYILENMIQTCVFRKNAEPAQLTLPIEAAEESLIQLCITMGKLSLLS
jgi:hypothetical protein